MVKTASKRIIIVDDNPMIPELLKEVINAEPDLEVSRIAAGREEFFRCLEDEFFDMALVDLSLKEREGGLRILEEMARRKISLPVIIVSAHDEAVYGQSSLSLGAAGFISKNNLISDLVKGIHAVLEGRTYVSGPAGSAIIRAAERQKQSRF